MRTAVSRKHRERAARERALLDAAERVFARRGYHDAGMVEIAREAEHAVGTLYAHFPSKESMYERLLRVRAEELAGSQRAALRGPGTARGRLEAALAAKIDFFVRRAAFIRLYAPATPLARAKQEVPADVRRLRRGVHAAVARIVAAGVAAGEVRGEPQPAHVATAYQTLSTTFLLEADPAEVTRAMRDVFFDPLFGASKRRRP